MIELAHGQPALAEPLRCGRTLIERFTGEAVEPPAMDSLQEWVQGLTLRLTATQACAVAEHLLGVLPLIDAFFESGDAPMAAVTSGVKLGALGLFTPTPDQGWGAAAMAGQSAGGALRLWGEARVPSQAPDGAIVLVRMSDTDPRLAWLDRDTPGVTQRGSRTGGPPPRSAPRWLAVDGARVADAHVSRPVTLAPGGELYERLETYAGVWALIALHYCRRTVRALRHAARTTRCAGESSALSASQQVAMDITEVEIETELATAAARRHVAHAAPHPSAVVLALSAARALAAVTAKANELRDHLGLAIDGSMAGDETAATLTAYLGGALTLENEVGRVLGLTNASAG